MGKTISGIWTSANERVIPSLFVVCIAFLFGSLAGMALAFRINRGDELMAVYLEQILSMASESRLVRPPLIFAYLRTLSWPVAAALVSCTALCLPGIPVVMALRGFFLSFSAASFARAFQGLGLEAAFLLIGLPALISVPVLLLLGARLFSSAWFLAGRERNAALRYDHEFMSHAVFCAGMCLLSAILEANLCPLLLSGISGAIT